MNTQILNMVKESLTREMKADPTKMAKLASNKPVAISYSILEGFCAFYSSQEAAQAAYEEVSTNPDTLKAELSINGLIVSATFKIPAEAMEYEEELYCGAAQVTAELSGVEFIPNWLDLHERANQTWLADTAF